MKIVIWLYKILVFSKISCNPNWCDNLGLNVYVNWHSFFILKTSRDNNWSNMDSMCRQDTPASADNHSMPRDATCSRLYPRRARHDGSMENDGLRSHHNNNHIMMWLCGSLMWPPSDHMKRTNSFPLQTAPGSHCHFKFSAQSRSHSSFGHPIGQGEIDKMVGDPLRRPRRIGTSSKRILVCVRVHESHFFVAWGRSDRSWIAFFWIAVSGSRLLDRVFLLCFDFIRFDCKFQFYSMVRWFIFVEVLLSTLIGACTHTFMILLSCLSPRESEEWPGSGCLCIWCLWFVDTLPAEGADNVLWLLGVPKTEGEEANAVVKSLLPASYCWQTRRGIGKDSRESNISHLSFVKATRFVSLPVCWEHSSGMLEPSNTMKWRGSGCLPHLCFHFSALVPRCL